MMGLHEIVEANKDPVAHAKRHLSDGQRRESKPPPPPEKSK